MMRFYSYCSIFKSNQLSNSLHTVYHRMHECLPCISNDNLSYACEQHGESKPILPWKVMDQNRMKHINITLNIWIFFQVECVCGEQYILISSYWYSPYIGKCTLLTRVTVIGHESLILPTLFINYMEFSHFEKSCSAHTNTLGTIFFGMKIE